LAKEKWSEEEETRAITPGKPGQGSSLRSELGIKMCPNVSAFSLCDDIRKIIVEV